MRIELDHGSSTAEAPSGPESTGPSRVGALLVGVVAFVVTGLVVLGLRPDDGTDATGAPITSTTEPDAADPFAEADATVDTTEPVATDAADETEPEDDELLASSAGPAQLDEIFIFEVMEAPTGGWLAHGFDEEAQLFRSIDGLEWVPLDGNDLDGTIVGIDRSGDEWLAIVDDADRWSSNDAFEAEDFTLEVFRSTDLLSWTRDGAHLPIAARGFPYPSQIRDGEMLAVTLQAPEQEGRAVVTEFVSQFVEVDPDIRLCSSTDVFPSQESTITLFSCFSENPDTVEVPVSALGDWAPDDFIECFAFLAGEFEVPELQVRHQPEGAEAVVSGAPFGGAIQLASIPGGWVSTNPDPSFSFAPQPNDDRCPDGADEDADFAVEGLVWWTRDGGYDSVELDLSFELGQAPTPVLLDDGRIGVATAEGFVAVDLATKAVEPIRARPEEFVESPAFGPVVWTMSGDGRAFAGGDSSRLFLAVDDGPWHQVRSGSVVQSPRILMSQGTSVWVQDDIRGTITRFDLPS